MLFPDYIFETSWEVCNKVGGIYTVLSTRAKSIQDKIKDHIIFLGPDCWEDKECPFFTEDKDLFADWQKASAKEGLCIKVGRWNIPGTPIAILVDYQQYFTYKDSLYTELWADYQVDSLHSYGDYDDSLMFSYAAAKVAESFYRHEIEHGSRVVYHANEWQTGAGALYIKKHLPEIGTIFTTHATCIGRSIAGNNKPLYDYLSVYNGDQMASELNMASKHSIEKQTAWNVDCFTTVSDITANECAELLDKPVDVVLPNGFENDFVPRAAQFSKKRREARKLLLKLANALTGCEFNDDTLIISTSGRYEFRNKGIDVFVDSMNRIRHSEGLSKKIVAFIEVPGWVGNARKDLQDRMFWDKEYSDALPDPFVTHELYNKNEDKVLGMLRWLDMLNRQDDKVKVILVPCYLNGDDGILNQPYYDLVIGNDLCIYPSYYEPWGYTPLEAVAFKVPCITTDLAGFGLWANKVKGSRSYLEDGAEVIHRTDSNYDEVCNDIRDAVLRFASMDHKTANACRANAGKLSKKALWSKFMKYYHQAYDIALTKAEKRS
jgi:glycosyltransferase involved in cell wall biosynthesis